MFLRISRRAFLPASRPFHNSPSSTWYWLHTMAPSELPNNESMHPEARPNETPLLNLGYVNNRLSGHDQSNNGFAGSAGQPQQQYDGASSPSSDGRLKTVNAQTKTIPVQSAFDHDDDPRSNKRLDEVDLEGVRSQELDTPPLAH